MTLLLLFFLAYRSFFSNLLFALDECLLSGFICSLLGENTSLMVSRGLMSISKLGLLPAISLAYPSLSILRPELSSSSSPDSEMISCSSDSLFP